MRLSKFIYFLSFCLIAVTSVAQDVSLGQLLTKNFPKNYIGQFADNSSSRNGTGVYGLKDGGVYIGDFSRNNYNGRGMMIAGNGKSMSNIPYAYAYVGGWLKGKKQGFGICYGLNGDVLYAGRFENDRPTGTYPSPTSNIEKYFSMMELDEGYYIGEVSAGLPNGFGLCIQNDDGAYWIGESENGARKGLSIFLYDANTWFTAKYRGDAYEVISNSDVYLARNQKNREINKRIWNEFFSGMMELTTNLVELSGQYYAQKNGVKAGQQSFESDDNSTSSSTRSSGNRSSSSSANKKKAPDCGTAWKADSRNYSDLETRLIRDKEHLSASDIRDIKNKMRSIRTKWSERGCLIVKSPYED